MHLGIDITFLQDQYSRRGIGTFGREVTSRLIERSDFQITLFGFGTLKQNLDLLKIKAASNVKFVSLGKPRSSNVFNPFYYHFKYKRKIRNSQVDYFFSPHLERMIPLKVVNTAVMVHDVIPYVRNTYSEKGFVFNKLKGLFYKYNLNRARKADLIFTNSNFSRDELVKKANFDEKKVSVTYLGINENFRVENIVKSKRDIRRILIIYNITKPYLIYYGGLEFNKNVDTLIKVFAKVVTQHPDLKLVLVGKEFKLGWDSKPIPLTNSAENVLKLLEELKIKHKVIITGEVDAHHLPVILGNAEVYLNLSEYEGFGLSVTEALAAGVPVVAANSSCYPEVLEDTAMLVPAKNVETIEIELLKVLQDNKLRTSMISKGLVLSEKYTWGDTADQISKKLIQVKKKPLIPEKLTIVVPYFSPIKGGAEENALNLAKSAQTAGYDVTVLTSLKKNQEKVYYENIDGIEVKRFRRLINAYYLGFYPGLFFGLLRQKSDIIHVHGFGFIWHDFCLLFKKIFSRSTKFINTPHGPFMAHKKYSFIVRIFRSIYIFMQRIFLNRIYNRVIQVNPYQSEWITEYGIDLDKIVYVPNGIPSEMFKKVKTTEAAKSLSLQRKFVIAFVGRYEEYKGVGDIISVLPEVLKIKKNIRFIAMGLKGAYYNELVTKIHELGLEKDVDLLLNPSDEMRDQVLTLAKVFVMPSAWEAFGIAILEAMAMDCAIISSSTEGGKFLVEEGVNGLLYDYGDQEKLQEQMIKLVNDKSLLQKMQKNNKKHAKKFLWEEVGDQYVNLIYNCINEKKEA